MPADAEYYRKYREKNREKLREYQRQYRLNHADELRKYKREYAKEQRRKEKIRKAELIEVFRAHGYSVSKEEK